MVTTTTKIVLQEAEANKDLKMVLQETNNSRSEIKSQRKEVEIKILSDQSIVVMIKETILKAKICVQMPFLTMSLRSQKSLKSLVRMVKVEANSETTSLTKPEMRMALRSELIMTLMSL